MKSYSTSCGFREAGNARSRRPTSQGDIPNRGVGEFTQYDLRHPIGGPSGSQSLNRGNRVRPIKLDDLPVLKSVY